MISITRKSAKHLDNLKKHNKIIEKGLYAALYEIGNDVKTEIKRLITEGPKTGRIYRYKGRPHQASAPGEAPANRSGELKDSTDYVVHSAVKLEVGDYAPYAGYLEHGTKKMEPRPHVIKAIKNNERNTIKSIEDNINKEIGI